MQNHNDIGPFDQAVEGALERLAQENADHARTADTKADRAYFRRHRLHQRPDRVSARCATGGAAQRRAAYSQQHPWQGGAPADHRR